MPRKAKIEHTSRILPDVSEAAATTAAGHNGSPGRDKFLFFMGQSIAREEEIKQARNKRKALRSRMKLEGLDLEVFDEALREKDRNDNTTFNRLQTLKTYFGFLDLPIGTQIQLFESPSEAKAFSQEALNKRARQEGYDLGVAGGNPDTQKYPELTVGGEAHQEGWNDGQDVNRQMFVELNESIAAAEKEKAAKCAAKAAKANGDGEDAGDGEEGAEGEDADAGDGGGDGDGAGEDDGDIADEGAHQAEDGESAAA